MKYVFSGFCEEDSLDLGYLQDGLSDAQWMEPDEFLKSAGEEQGAITRTWVWLYRPPWSILAFGTDVEADDYPAFAERWADCQRSALKLRLSLQTRLFLVNRDSTSAPDLNASLGLGEPVATRLPDFSRPWARPMLGKLFEWMEPRLWEVFEALESAAWIPSAEPVYRHNVEPLPADNLAKLTAILRGVPHLEAENLRLEQALSDLRAELDARIAEHEEDAERRAEELLDLRTENRQLLDQLHQEQEDAAAGAQAQREALAEELSVLRTENEQLLEQLHQVQEDLEHEMEGNRGAWNEERDRLRAELESLAADRAEAEAGWGQRLASVETENGELLAQLLHTQETLSECIEARKDMDAVLVRCGRTMVRARALIEEISGE